MDKIAEIKEKKEAAYRALHEVLDGLEQADWQRPVYGHEQSWTVRDLLTHLVTAGPGLLRAAQLTAVGQLKMRPDFDLDLWREGLLHSSLSGVSGQIPGTVRSLLGWRPAQLQER